MKYVFSPRPGAYYYRRNGKFWGRLLGTPGGVDFARAYAAIDATFGRQPLSPASPGTFFEAMAQAYLRSAEYIANLKPKTQAAYRYDIDILPHNFWPFRPD